jgi:hypothetical protein
MMDPIDLNTYVVPFEKLRWVCLRDLFPFECSTDIEPLKEYGAGSTEYFQEFAFYGVWLNN